MPDLSRFSICLLAGTLGQGGAERQLFYIIKSLRQADAKVRLLCLTRGEYWEERIRELGVAVIWVGADESRPLRLARIISELRKDRPAIIQSQHFYTNLYVTAAARAIGLREIGAIRNNVINEVRANGPLLGRLSLRAPRVMAANSRVAIRNAIAMGVPQSRLHFLPNVIQTDLFASNEGIPTNTMVRILMVGRLVKQKRVDRFLNVVSRLAKHSSRKIKGVVVGDGPLRPELEAQAARLGLLPNLIEFKGLVSNMENIYKEADLFVLTSDWEGTPNVVLEAMASGLPIVATRVGGVPELVQDEKTGLLVDAENENELLAAISRLIAESELRDRFSRNAKEQAETHSLNRLPVHLENLYEAAII